ncbi:hypothetical protein BX666DRAFT_1898866 [Dichotomocladium elegans]|nr:hypothetical protein BX666DRAFT_1898866 [Dichotomocladium elegans]
MPPPNHSMSWRHISGDWMSDKDEPLNGAPDVSMEECEFGLVADPALVWASTKYKPEQMVQLINLIQNKNCED